MLNEGIEMTYSISQYKIIDLVKYIKKYQINDISDVLSLINLSESIFREWLNENNKLRKKLIKCKKINIKSIFEWEAEEELVIGLLILLKTRMSDYIQRLLN